MGYTTDFFGTFAVSPPLNDAERDYLTRFSTSRRMDRARGPYYAQPGSDFGQSGDTDDVTRFNDPPDGQPGLWCQWVPTEDGSGIQWDQGEKFYDAAEWIEYLIVHFLKPGAVVSTYGPAAKSFDPAFEHFTFDHVVNGEVTAQGEEPDDRWKLVVRDNVVSVAGATFGWGPAVPLS